MQYVEGNWAPEEWADASDCVSMAKSGELEGEVASVVSAFPGE